MKEQLISFETARLAKEKGFDLDTNYYYGEDGKLDYDCFTPNIVYIKDGCFLEDDKNKLASCKAPTQSLLQKWLREKHKIFVFVKPKWIKKKMYFTTNYNEKVNTTKLFNIYEEALEEGLVEGLEMIEL